MRRRKAESLPEVGTPPRITLRTDGESSVGIEASVHYLIRSHVLPAPGKATPGGRERLRRPDGCQGASIPAVPYPLTSPPSRSLSPVGRQNMISGSETSGPSLFPLGGAVAFCGSRHGSPFPVAPVVSAVVAAGGSVRVGCASGVDAAVRSCCPSAVVLRASSFPGPPRARLAARTGAVVAGASALCVSTGRRPARPRFLAGPPRGSAARPARLVCRFSPVCLVVLVAAVPGGRAGLRLSTGSFAVLMRPCSCPCEGKFPAKTRIRY